MNSINILIADDDSDDRLLTKEAFEENKLKNLFSSWKMENN